MSNFEVKGIRSNEESCYNTGQMKKNLSLVILLPVKQFVAQAFSLTPSLFTKVLVTKQ